MKSPAFQFYPADYLADMRVRMLSWASRGLYMDLLCYCWREGWIPSDGSAIAQLSGCHDLAIIEPCLELFESHPNDPKKLVHKRLEEEREGQERRRIERSESGRRGAESKWGKGKKAKPKSRHGSANGSAINQPMAKDGSSSSTSSSTSIREELALPYLSPEFSQAWSEWVQHRAEKKKPLKPTTIKAQLKMLAKIGEARAIAMIEHTIFKGWEGLREDDQLLFKTPQNPNPLAPGSW